MASMDFLSTVTMLEDGSIQVGKITNLGGGKFMWVIEDVFSVIYKAPLICSRYETHSNNCSFYMQLHFSKLLKLSIRIESQIRYMITLGMNTGFRGKMETHSGERNGYGIFQVRAWMSYEEFKMRRAEILKNGSLTVFCTLKCLDIEDASVAVVPEQLRGDENVEQNEEDIDEEKLAIQQWKTVKKMQEDMQNLLSKAAEDRDVTFKVQDKEFPAHRNILGARSPVFKSMFGHDTAESRSGEVTISDCDPDIFPDFLTHLYTGSTRRLNSANVCSLYVLADKYCMDSLKEESVEFMKEHLSVDSFCDCVALAWRHEEGELVEMATAFFRDHMRAIIKTPKWVTLLRENSTAANELLICATS